MKLLFLTVTIATVLAANAQQKYTIKGKIEGNTPEKLIYMSRFMDHSSAPDSAYIYNNEFEFSGEVVNPELHTIYFDNSRRETRRLGMVRIFTEPEPVVLGLNLKDMFSGSSVEGGKINKDFFRVEKYLSANYRSKIDSLSQLAATAPAEKRDILISEMGVIREDMVKYCKGYINKNRDSAISLLLLSQFYTDLSDEEFKRIMSAFPKEIKQTLLYEMMEKH